MGVEKPTDLYVHNKVSLQQNGCDQNLFVFLSWELCKLLCPHDNALSFVLKRNQGFLTAVVICECSRNFSGSGWEVGLAFHLKGCSASGRHGAMIGKWGFL